jgi:hypothetical protein
LPPNIGVKSPVEVLKEKDLEKIAEIMLQQAEKLCSQNFVTPEDVMNGIVKLNLLFLGNLFIKHHGLVLGAQDQENELRSLGPLEHTGKISSVKVVAQLIQIG